jgi:LysR family hydrogen peroxide-inducible transcriptional activator
MTLTQLEYVVALDAEKHFAKAAERCHITQPSLSMQVQKLEEELGVQIFLRTSPVTTTESGRMVVMQAQKILSEAQILLELVKQEKNIISGKLKIAIIPTLAPYLLPQFLQAFIKKFPKVHLTIHELTTEQIVRQLHNGSLDAGILATPLNVAELKESFLFNEEFVAYVSRNEKLFNKKYMLPEDFDVHDMWLLEEGHCLRSQVMNLCALQKNSSIERHLDYAAGSIETLKSLVDKSGGITLLPELSTYDMTPARKNMLRYFKSPTPVREISLVTLKTFTKIRLIEVLRQSILDNLPMPMKRSRKVEVVKI